MNKSKRFYSSPTAELLVVRFEENIMSLTGVAQGGIRNMSQTNGDIVDNTDGWDY